MPTNSLTVFDNFVQLAFKGLIKIPMFTLDKQADLNDVLCTSKVYLEPCQTSLMKLFSQKKTPPWIFDRVLNVRLHSVLYDFMCIKNGASQRPANFRLGKVSIW